MSWFSSSKSFCCMRACNLTFHSPCLFRVHKTVCLVQFVHFSATYITRLDIEVDLLDLRLESSWPWRCQTGWHYILRNLVAAVFFKLGVVELLLHILVFFLHAVFMLFHLLSRSCKVRLLRNSIAMTWWKNFDAKRFTVLALLNMRPVYCKFSASSCVRALDL